jgi:hypothetical protein
MARALAAIEPRWIELDEIHRVPERARQAQTVEQKDDDQLAA